MRIYLLHSFALHFFIQTSAYIINGCESLCDTDTVRFEEVWDTYQDTVETNTIHQESNNFEIIINNTGLYIKNGDKDEISNIIDLTNVGNYEAGAVIAVPDAGIDAGVAGIDADDAGMDADDFEIDADDVEIDADDAEIDADDAEIDADDAGIDEDDAGFDEYDSGIDLDETVDEIDAISLDGDDNDPVLVEFGGPVKAHGTVSIVRKFGSGLLTSPMLSATNREIASTSEPSNSDQETSITTLYVPRVVYPIVYHHPPVPLLSSVRYPMYSLPNSSVTESLTDSTSDNVGFELKSVPFCGIVPASGSVTIVGNY